MSGQKDITRRLFGQTAAGVSLLAAPYSEGRSSSPAQASSLAQSMDASITLPGIWHKRLGTPEQLTPVRARHYQPARQALAQLPVVTAPRIGLQQIRGETSRRGYHVTIPLEPGEMIYGLGLQFQSTLQRGRKKTLRVNADPTGDTGDSHAPVPFYVSNRGYGIFVDTARYATFYCGNKVRKASRRTPRNAESEGAKVAAKLPQAYARFNMNEASEVLIEVPEAQGVEIYVFGGPGLREAVQRYNLFSGGGPLPPRWGLGFWYRAYGGANQEEILTLAQNLRTENIPCDVLGLEPGWQSHSYSCSFVWSDNFPDPNVMLGKLNDGHFHVNLWEHAFTHPSSPIYKPLLPYSGDYEVWDGVVPDFLGAQARSIFGDYHEKTLVAHGVSGFKLDECDNSDYTRSWSFPELSRFPSGADGEQMHCFFGLRYQDAIQGIFERRKLRTWGLVRSSHALAAPYPYTLYSDLYDHREFIRGVANAGFSGLLWCPEVRDAKDPEDLIRRLQTVVLSPLAMVNAWYIRNPPWKQVDRSENDSGHFAEDWQQLAQICRQMINLRMQLVPYLYAAFVRYHQTGLPPFRALVMDYPEDAETWAIDDQCLAGESLLVAPVVAGERQRSVYLPAGEWFDFWTGKVLAGGQTLQISVPLEQIPFFVKAGTLLPLAKPTLHTADANSFELSVRAYGRGNLECVLYEDDGSFSPVFTSVTLALNPGESVGTVRRSSVSAAPSYAVRQWERVPG